MAPSGSGESGPYEVWASSMKSARERMDMHAAYQEVGSYRAAAEICGTTDKTIKRAVEKARASETTRADEVAVAHNYGPVTDIITERVAKTEGRISATRLLPVVRAAGYSGSARNLRRAGLEPVPLRVLRRQPSSRDDHGRARRVHGDDRRRAEDTCKPPRPMLDVGSVELSDLAHPRIPPWAQLPATGTAIGTGGRFVPRLALVEHENHTCVLPRSAVSHPPTAGGRANSCWETGRRSRTTQTRRDLGLARLRPGSGRRRHDDHHGRAHRGWRETASS